jgi:hypothetical protein
VKLTVDRGYETSNHVISFFFKGKVEKLKLKTEQQKQPISGVGPDILSFYAGKTRNLPFRGVFQGGQDFFDPHIISTF